MPDLPLSTTEEGNALSNQRSELYTEGGLLHKYGVNDKQLSFVIAYFLPDFRLNNPAFLADLEACTKELRKREIVFAVDGVKFILYNRYSLAKDACILETKKFKFGEKVVLPDNCKNLAEMVMKAYEKQAEAESDPLEKAS